MFDDLKNICLKFGEYFQIQDDYLDCFGDYTTLGKIGRDIEDSKCCWVFVTAMEIASDEIKNQLVEKYGADDEETVLEIKEIYRKLDIPSIYEKWEKKMIE